MVQSISDNFNRPIYNGVKINIKKPEINAGNQTNTIVNDNGIYNAVSIDIDNPSVNTTPKQVYDYPKNSELITYDMFKPQLPLETRREIAYHTTNIILPKIENEIELELDEINEKNFKTKSKEENNIPEEISIDEILLTPNYIEQKNEKINEKINEFSSTDEENKIVNQRPEIIPAEEIKPEIDMSKVLENLASEDYDIQALQMEKIVSTAQANPEKAINYITRDVFDNLIKIINMDSENLKKPTPEQLELRDKVMVNITIANANEKEVENLPIPYDLSKEDLNKAAELSEFELAIRNKEYALTTMAILSKIYIEEVKQATGETVPLMEIPGIYDIVNTLKYNTNAGIKIAAIDSLKYINQPEYKDYLSEIFIIASNDVNKEVANTAQNALEKISNENNK